AGVFLFEGGLIGALGGLAGAALASIVITVVAAINSWSAYLNVGWIALGPVLGMVVGLAASAYPAMRAATIQPAIAVRSD
ncbi:MAG: ABC transporter permease, partial [Ancrocorticia sp.]